MPRTKRAPISLLLLARHKDARGPYRLPAAYESTALDRRLSPSYAADHETDDAQLPGAMLVDLARALRVSTDELLGVTPVREKTSPKTARLLKRLRRIEELPPADQRAVLVDAMLDTRHRSMAPPRAKRKAN